MAKEPRLGISKTRLARDIGAEGARRLAEAFVLDTLQLVSDRSNTQVLIAYAPDDADAWFAERAPGATLARQPVGDLGARMSAAFAQVLEPGMGSGAKARRCVMVGMDTPHLAPERFDEAFEALSDGNELVLGPSEDGGYYLIGLNCPAPRLFAGIPWSTGRVYGDTVARANELELAHASLATEFDVDDGAGLQRLREHLRVLQRAPATRRALDATASP